jgi:hypothetical protein
MEINRTAVVKLSIPDDRRDDLKRTMNTFRDAAQRFVDRGWDGDNDGYVITSGNHLQRLVYGKFEAKASPFRAGMKPTNSIQPPSMA